MKSLKCLALVLTLVEIICVTALVQDVLAARQVVSTGTYLHSYAGTELGYDNSQITAPSSDVASYVDDDYLSERWGLAKIGATRAWQITRGDPSVVIAVLDTGIDRDHRNLGQRIVAEVNFTSSPTSDDLYGHGTHMAGTIAAIAPECRLMNVKVADDSGKCEPAVVARGIVWAVKHGAKIINLSLAIAASPDLEEAVNYAWSRGTVLVAAAGNKGGSGPNYPAYYENCLAVAGVNENDRLALLSSYGEWVDVAAPGFNIYSELPGNQYGYKTGTSAAAAHVSGVAALVFTVAEDANGDGAINDDVRRAVEGSCTPIEVDGAGRGVINALRAVTGAIS